MASAGNLIKLRALAALLVAAYVAHAASYCARSEGTVRAIPDLSMASNCDAFGDYFPTINTTGWNVLRLTSNATVSDDAQAFAAGLFEGFLTAQDIVNFHENTLGDNGSFGPVSPTIRHWMKQNDEWVIRKSRELAASDPRWAHVALILRQIDGMLEGVAAAGFNYSREQFLLSLGMPDVVSDLQIVFSDPPPPGFRSSRRVPRLQRLHCSSIVKVKDDLSDLFFGHTTWMNFNTMLRVFKTITLNFNSVPIGGRTAHFSSYPGQIASTDDFYVLSSGLGVMETSFSIFNLSVYDGNLSPQSLLSSFRSTLANRMATSGPEWGDAFGFLNSGTYNNQWIVVDMNRFMPGTQLAPSTLTIVEQLPGIIEVSDQTEALSFGYWPSYNVPISPRLYHLAGYDSPSASTDPEFNSYQNTVRAQLFRQLQGSVQSLSDLQHLLQYNQYQTNPLELANPLYAIAARGDLVAGNPQGFGGIDCKVTSHSMFNRTGGVLAYNGPTQQQPIFSFATSNASGLSPHAGLPTVFNFTWQQFAARP